MDEWLPERGQTNLSQGHVTGGIFIYFHKGPHYFGAGIDFYFFRTWLSLSLRIRLADVDALMVGPVAANSR